MQYLVTAREMKEIDRFSIEEVGIPSLVLMERAALAVADAAREYLERKGKRRGKVLVVAGTGNNGADGLAAARMLADAGHEAAVLYLGEEERATKEWSAQARVLRRLEIPLLQAKTAPAEYTEIENFDVVIDAVFGIGISRPVEGIYREWVERINAGSAYVIAVDAPSGLNTDTGGILGACVRADETVTFGCKKVGMALYPGRQLCGRVRVAQVGFPAPSIERVNPQCVSLEKCDPILPERPSDANKGTFGKVLIAAGSRNMAGAACFAAQAALAVGAGLVRVLTVEANREIMQTLVPEAILTTWNAVPEEKELREILAWADVVAAGPGLGCTEDSRKLLEGILKLCRVPLVLDADALNLLAMDSGLESLLHENTILTPHPGELARLMGRPAARQKENPIQAAREAALRFGCICVCKDAATVTAAPSGPVCVNQSGNEGMATGGSGDVLTGVIAGFLAGGAASFTAAAAGAYVHGLSGDAAREAVGSRGMGPRQMVERLSAVFAELERNR